MSVRCCCTGRVGVSASAQPLLSSRKNVLLRSNSRQVVICSNNIIESGDAMPVTRRGVSLLLLGMTMVSSSEQAVIAAENGSAEQGFKYLKDQTLAYSFEYPVVTTSGAALPLVLSRKPERYSSAAPLTADARQRIVCELVSLKDAVTLSVSVGPPAGSLRTTKQEDWTARQVAEQVLVDRSTGRVTSGQRVSLSSVEDAFFVEKNGIQYCVYEHISQGSPTLLNAENETYRHARAVTVARPGLDGQTFLYTLNVSCPQDKWGDLQEPFQKAVDSFTLIEPGKEYVPPNQDPWRFF